MPVPIPARPLAALLALAAGATLAACGAKTLDAESLQTSLAQQLAPQAGVSPDDVSVACPDGQEAKKGHRFDCTLTAPNGDEVIVNVTVRNDDGGYDAIVPPQQFR